MELVCRKARDLGADAVLMYSLLMQRQATPRIDRIQVFLIDVERQVLYTSQDLDPPYGVVFSETFGGIERVTRAAITQYKEGSGKLPRVGLSGK